MTLYLSSYKLGADTDRLVSLFPHGNRRTAYISNAMDSPSRVQPREVREQEDMEALRGLGLEVELLDLRKFFGKPELLEKTLQEFGIIWVCGGNTFVLRQAMRLSGFEKILPRWLAQGDVLYGGYSAGCCVLAPQLKGMDLVDDPNVFPYDECQETIWEGLGLVNYLFLPHFDSDHPESEDVGKAVHYCTQNGIEFQAVRDGEVLIEKSPTPPR